MPPRVAYFPDSFHEVNGVAHTSRNFVAYAERHGLPLLCVRAAVGGNGRRAGGISAGSLQTLELERSRAAIRMEKDLEFDPLFFRHKVAIADALEEFRPDLIHITGPSELGIFGAFFAWKRGIPLAASWHTNVHEYAARRMNWLTRQLPGTLAAQIEGGVEAGALEAATRLYRLAQVTFAPNAELCALLEAHTGRPCHLMRRGVDTALFDPAKRERREDDSSVVLGYVGRLSIEKNVALLGKIQRELTRLGGPLGGDASREVRFLIVGQGAEEEALRRDLPTAAFAGVLRGEALARAYAGMDLLVFPSHTDTFGNVVLEALASGVPAMVTPGGGPKYIVRDGETGYVVPDERFAGTIAELLGDPARLKKMREAARAYALDCSWDAVFDRVYAAYPESASVKTG